ncbi:MAG: peptide deformylase [Candidatus Pacebacteria bacterium]|nr:peptide deformylase [Candidatus Paceibacterota bacterium]
MELITNKDNPILRQKSLPVQKIDAGIRNLVSQMIETMKLNNGVGLAAIQTENSLRIVVCEVNDKIYALINPEIIKTSSETEVFEEGCLSIPNLFGDVERPEKVTVKATNLDGKKIKIKAFGLLSRVLQHEIDHLDGILFIDKAKNLREEKQGPRI